MDLIVNAETTHVLQFLNLSVCTCEKHISMRRLCKVLELHGLS